MKIYTISGLGADKRIFKYLKLNFELIHLDWIHPNQNESISSYSKRLAQYINPTEKFGLLGVSFGGIVAQEIARISNPQFVILLSTMQSSKERNLLYSITGSLNLISIIPTKLFSIPNNLAAFLFSAKQKELLFEILNDTDPKFTKWALTQFLRWKSHSNLKIPVIRIHGSKDRLIALPNNFDGVIINETGHFMVVDKAQDVSLHVHLELSKFLNNLPKLD